MKLNATIGDIEAAVQLQDEGALVLAGIDGRKYELDVHQASGGFLVVSNGRVFDCRVEGRPESGSPIEVVVGTRRYSITLVDPKRLRRAAGAASHADGASRIVASMPGKVVRVLAEMGASVEAGAGLVVVEAMKMQNEMKSPKAGTVAAVNVKTGDTVNAGDVLVVVE